MPTARILIAALVLALAAGAAQTGSAQAATTLTRVGGGQFGLIVDGTSNTIQLGEQSSAVVCFRNVSSPTPSIADGTSNTLLLTESFGLPFTAGQLFQYGPIQQIADGTSNTIFLGEGGPSVSYCLSDVDLLDPVPVADGTSNTIVVGENGIFDICFNNILFGSIADGTSNTIFLGEQVPQRCYSEVAFSDDLQVAVAVPAPGMLALFGLGLVGLGVAALNGQRLRT